MQKIEDCTNKKVNPNPFSDRLWINANRITETSVTAITLINSVGQSYQLESNALVTNENGSVEINSAGLNLTDGIYELRLLADSRFFQRK